MNNSGRIIVVRFDLNGIAVVQAIDYRYTHYRRAATRCRRASDHGPYRKRGGDEFSASSKILPAQCPQSDRAIGGENRSIEPPVILDAEMALLLANKFVPFRAREHGKIIDVLLALPAMAGVIIALHAGPLGHAGSGNPKFIYREVRHIFKNT